MTTSAPVTIMTPRHLDLVETAAPTLSAAHRSAMDRVWEKAAGGNPSFYDGPTVLCTGLELGEGRRLTLSWARVTYRYFALRRVEGAPVVSSLFVTALQPSGEGDLLVGRMAAWTAASGRWQIPGGTVEPPEGRQPLDADALRQHASRELSEETGVSTDPAALTLWAVTRGEHGNIGVHFAAPALSADVLRRCFSDLLSSETAQGREAELDRIALLGSAAGLAELQGPHVDYLKPLLEHYAARGSGKTHE